jgi:hypothetical protein
MNNYQTRINDNGDIYWYLPYKVILPTEDKKYISTIWNSDYTLSRLANRVYGDASLYWIILAVNNITNPFEIKDGDKIKILLKEYVKEIGFEI